MSQNEIIIDVWSDFVCPWCYLVSTSLIRLEQSHNVVVRWHAYELRPEGSPPIPAWYKEKIEQSRPQFRAIAKANYGLEIKEGPFGINSRPALIGMKYAEQQGQGRRYHDRIFQAYFQDTENIEDLSVLLEIVTSLGMDGNDFEKSLTDIELEADVLSDIQTANYFGITGVPAMLFMDKYLVSGAQPYEELVSIVEQVQQREK